MDFFQAQDLFKQLYPAKNINFEFDKSCIRVIELIYTDGLPNPVHHVEYRKLKVIPEGLSPIYIDIIPHRENWEWDKVRSHVEQSATHN